MEIIGAEREGQRLRLATDQAYAVCVEARAENIIRVWMGERETASPLGVIPAEPVSVEVTQTEEIIRMDAGRLSLTVHRSNGRLAWHDGGRLLLTQSAPELAPKPVLKYTTGTVRKVRTIDGERSFVEGMEPFEDRMGYRVKVQFDFAGDEWLHGFGQAEEGIYDYRGAVQYLYQNNMRIPISFFQSGRGYGVLFDTGSLMTFNDDGRGSYLHLDTVDALDFYLIAGGTPDAVIAGFRELTGSAALLPKWAYGYIQSKEAYRNQDELVAVAREYRRRRVPLDCVVQDWNTWAPGLWGNKRVDKSRYPDLAAANRALHDMHVHTMVSVWPNMNEGGEDHKEFARAGMLLNDHSTYDAFDEQARGLYWKQVERELFSGGFDSWWCDSTEPFCGPDWSGPVQREPWERYRLVGDELKKFLDPAHANLYAQRHARGIYENQRRAAPEKRVFNLTRSGSAGSQRYGTVLWSGDISATWDTLRRQIAEGLNMSMSGMPWWTLDIGGFFTVWKNWRGRGCGANGNPEPLWFWHGEFERGVDDPGYRELYVRWLQMGTFLPVFRSHGTDTPREIWQFGDPGTLCYDAIEKFIRLRYRLLPTIYSLALRVALEDYTMLRSLLFDYGGDPTAVKIADQFMLGGSLLVCPVTEPQFHGPGGAALSGKAERRCYLPAGTDWYNYWSGERSEGGQWLTVSTPLDSIPLFVPAGAILVTETASLQYAGQVTDEPLEITVWPGADGSFVLYDDNCDGYGYEQGDYNRIALEWDAAAETLVIGASQHSFPQSLKGRRCLVRADSRKREIFYTGEQLTVKF